MTISRYDRAIRHRDGAHQFHGLRRPIQLPTRPDDRYHVVSTGDRVDRLAHQYLGDATLWWLICDLNDIAFPLDLQPGTRLRIPSMLVLALL